MAVEHNLLPRIINSGLGVLAPGAGISALLSVLAIAGSGPQLVVSPFNWRTLMAGAKGKIYPVFREFEDEATPPPMKPLPPPLHRVKTALVSLL